MTRISTIVTRSAREPRRPEPLRRTASTTGWPPDATTVDLHCHTDRSDGVLSPTAAVHGDGRMRASRSRRSADHDTLAGYRELRDAAATRRAALADGPRSSRRSRSTASPIATLIELGVELEEGELHILGYGVDRRRRDVRSEARRPAQRAQGSAAADHRPAARARRADRRADRARARERGGGRSAAHRAGDGRGRARRDASRKRSTSGSTATARPTCRARA